MLIQELPSRWLVSYLTGRVHGSGRRHPIDLGRLKPRLRPGDVVLVGGRTRIAHIIMYLTQSSWSHAMLYIGDTLLRYGGPAAEAALDLYGEDAAHLVVESDLKRGVSAVPISKYWDQDLRICRPRGLTQGQLDRVVAEVLRHLGYRYDRQNIFDLARYLIPFHLLPRRWRKTPLYLGASTSREVICSALIAKAFYRVGLSIQSPLVSIDGDEGASKFKHPSYIVPRDFDLSEAFEVVNST